MDVLGGNLIREQELNKVLCQIKVLGPAKRKQAYLFTVDGISVEILLLNRIVFYLAALRDIDRIYCRPKVMVDRDLIFPRVPKAKPPFSFSDDPISPLAKSIMTIGRRRPALHVQRCLQWRSVIGVVGQ